MAEYPPKRPPKHKRLNGEKDWNVLGKQSASRPKEWSQLHTIVYKQQRKNRIVSQETHNWLIGLIQHLLSGLTFNLHLALGTATPCSNVNKRCRLVLRDNKVVIVYVNSGLSFQIPCPVVESLVNVHICRNMDRNTVESLFGSLEPNSFKISSVVA